jgi:predicted MFS family arabinose efflux permease
MASELPSSPVGTPVRAGSLSASDEGAGVAREWKKGWGVVLAGALGMGVASSTVYSLGVFMQPLEQEFGWSRAEISSGMTISSVVSVFSAPLMGIVIDRVGARRVALLGVTLFCLAIACFSLATPSLWSWWGLWLFYAACAATMKPTVWATGVSSMFVKGRGLALSLMLCGTGLGSSLTPIIGNYLIDGFGWRTAYVGLAAFWFVLVAPPVFLFFTSAKDLRRIKPELAQAAAPLVGVTAREGLLSWRFAVLALAGFLAALTVVSFVANLVPILSSQGLARQQAANIAGLVGLATVAGRLLGGYLLDRINGNLVGGVSLLLGVAASLLLLTWPGSGAIAAAAVLLLGLALGAELDCVAYLTTRHFGMRSFGVLFGTISGLLALATGLGPFLVSLVYDFSGGYGMVLIAYVPLCLLASACFFSLGRYPDWEGQS